MKVMHLSAECYPVAKVGGLGDVVGALPKYLCKAGIDAYVVLPYYNRTFVKEHQFEKIYNSHIFLGSKKLKYSILKESEKSLGFDLYLVHISGLLDRPEIYCYPDEIEQFIAYQLATLSWITETNIRPDLIHCHDHHSGLIPFLLSHGNLYKSISQIPSICTIHNGQYQGWLGWDKISYLGEFDLKHAGLLDWGNCINSLAASVKCCWAYTTVSPSYLEELKQQANGLEKLFQMEHFKGQGIINGIDPHIWDPAIDKHLNKKYSSTDVRVGKLGSKIDLCSDFDLNPELTLLAFIGRLVGEKGADLLPEFISSCLIAYEGKLNVILLGSGDPEIEKKLKVLTETHPKHYAHFIGYDETLSHRIYAGADFLLMPSRVEPCGLNQLYAVKYGTIPIVHSTGGLKDSVIDLDISGGYGIKFDKLEFPEMLRAVSRALKIFNSPKKLNEIRTRGMELDFSWDRSANEYINLYKKLLKK